MSVPGLNTTLIVSVPSPTDCEVMYSMLSTPLTSCSIGVATVSAITSRRGAGIGGADADGGRRDLGIFRDRQRTFRPAGRRWSG